MKKEEIIRRCYGGMKERHGVETIILFHVGDSFEAYFDDAETITRITEVPRFKMTAAGIPAIRISDAPWKNVETGCWMQDARYACPSPGVSGRHILKINETNTETGR